MKRRYMRCFKDKEEKEGATKSNGRSYVSYHSPMLKRQQHRKE